VPLGSSIALAAEPVRRCCFYKSARHDSTAILRSIHLTSSTARSGIFHSPHERTLRNHDMSIFDAMQPRNGAVVSQLILNGSNVNAKTASSLTVIQYAALEYFKQIDHAGSLIAAQQLRPTDLLQKKSRVRLTTQNICRIFLLDRK
jgi:hypothetical protein